MDSPPVLTFDTSAINRLTDDQEQSALIGGLGSGFHVRLTFTSISEAIACTNPNRRRQLCRLSQRLLSFGDCIDPQHALLRKMISAFEQSPSFDWRSVDVSLPEAADGIAREENVTDEISEQVRLESQEIKDKFEAFYTQMKAMYDKLFAEGLAVRPMSFPESMTRIKETGTFVELAKILYEKGADHSTTSIVVRKFLDACPPFQALMVALCVRRYSSYLKTQNTPSLKAHAADTFMAVCLPYCEQFITADKGHLRCFREVVSYLALPATVSSYKEFKQQLLVST